MGRAIVRQPQAFLMDEPLSNLDAKLRVQMRADIKKIQSNLGVTTLYVTHDQVEAMTMGHRVAVMRKGELQQVAAPEDLYHRPLNMFVGGFIGSPAMNMLEAGVERRNGSLRDRGRAVADRAHPGGSRRASGARCLRRPPDRARHPAREPGGRGPRRRRPPPRLRGEAELREALGSEMLVHFSIDARPAVTDEVRELAEDVGDDRALGQLAEGVPARAALVGRFSPDTRIREGDSIEVAVSERGAPLLRPRVGPRGVAGTSRSW